MNGRTGRGRDVESYRDHHGDQGGREESSSSRRHGHDPVPGEIDVDGAPMAVDRCRRCGIVVLDSKRPGGPCPGRNHTLTEFGVTPPTDREQEANPPASRLALVDR